MSKKRSQTARRKIRTDAQLNRQRILEAAKQAFTRSGASSSLDDIAKEASVGPGTLFRHFPTRDALLEAVYRAELEKLAAAERKFEQTLPRKEALRAWMLRFIDYFATKKIIAPALNTLVGGHSKVELQEFRSKQRLMHWWSGQSQAVTYALTLIHSICFAP